MKLALLGFPIAHSLSPALYREFLGDKLTSYDLLEIAVPSDIPALTELSKRYNGLSITSPHKKHFFDDVIINSPIVKELKAINTIAFRKDGIYGTNTDVIAVEQILHRMKGEFQNLFLIILGEGVMAKVTVMVAKSLSIPFQQYSRKKGDDLKNLDLSSESENQTVVINSCTRDFVFEGKLNPKTIFWDYNYSYLPHQTTIPARVKTYLDGQEMLRLQAIAAIEFWSAT